jgi:hypothetical protein
MRRSRLHQDKGTFADSEKSSFDFARMQKGLSAVQIEAGLANATCGFSQA